MVDRGVSYSDQFLIGLIDYFAIFNLNMQGLSHKSLLEKSKELVNWPALLIELD